MRVKRSGRFKIFVEILINILSIKIFISLVACRIDVHNIVSIRFTPKRSNCDLHFVHSTYCKPNGIIRRCTFDYTHASCIGSVFEIWSKNLCSAEKQPSVERLIQCLKNDEAEAMHPCLTHVYPHECIHVLRLPATSHKRAAVLQNVLYVVTHAYSIQWK